MNVAQPPTDLPLNVLMAIGIFMQGSAAKKQTLVLSETIKAIEGAFPCCHFPSRELGDAIISAANSCGLAVYSPVQRIVIDDE